MNWIATTTPTTAATPSTFDHQHRDRRAHGEVGPRRRVRARAAGGGGAGRHAPAPPNLGPGVPSTAPPRAGPGRCSRRPRPGRGAAQAVPRAPTRPPSAAAVTRASRSRRGGDPVVGHALQQAGVVRRLAPLGRDHQRDAHSSAGMPFTRSITITPNSPRPAPESTGAFPQAVEAGGRGEQTRPPPPGPRRPDSPGVRRARATPARRAR